jgi:hypothetical protein
VIRYRIAMPSGCPVAIQNCTPRHYQPIRRCGTPYARHVAGGKPLLAECGGMMSLFEQVTDKGGKTHAFAGLLPGISVMQKRLAALGMQVTDLPEGRLQGHTFHYSKSETPLTPIVRAQTPDGREGEAIYRRERQRLPMSTSTSHPIRKPQPPYSPTHNISIFTNNYCGLLWFYRPSKHR